MLKQMQILEDGRIPAKDLKIEGGKRRSIGKEYKRLLNEFEVGGIMAQTGLWNLAREKMLQDRAALPEEEVHFIREYKAMHEEYFLSSRLEEAEEGKKESKMEVDRETEEEVSEKMIRGKEKEENEMVNAKRRCLNSV